ncbi:MAG: hypothetical protein AVDCRST_MAG68-726, partial [uncultured Gemmatimonadetes bacterium]
EGDTGARRRVRGVRKPARLPPRGGGAARRRAAGAGSFLGGRTRPAAELSRAARRGGAGGHPCPSRRGRGDGVRAAFADPGALRGRGVRVLACLPAPARRAALDGPAGALPVHQAQIPLPPGRCVHLRARHPQHGPLRAAAAAGQRGGGPVRPAPRRPGPCRLDLRGGAAGL